MKKLRTLSSIFLLAFAAYVNSTTIETTTNLNVYYPEYTKIDLVCGQMP
jgi:hypothetical protein